MPWRFPARSAGALRLGLVLALSLPAAASAQDKNDYPWKLSYVPYIGPAPNDWPMFDFYTIYRKQADYYASPAEAAAVSFDAGMAWHGSWKAIAAFRAPQLWPGWRLAATAGASQDVRFGYFGLGNETTFDPVISDTSENYYRDRRTRYFGRAEVSRIFLTNFRVALAFGVEHSRLAPLTGPSLFATDHGTEIVQTSGTERLTLVFDTRDREYNPSRGVFVEASALAGEGLSGSKAGFSRTTVIARGYFSPREGTVLTARLGGSGNGGEVPLASLYELPVWESQISILGGATTQRALWEGRYAGGGLLFGGAEVRHDLINLNDLGAITLLAFVDAGRVFDKNGFSLTTEGLHVGGGGGVALRLMRSSIFTFNFAGGPMGFNFTAGSGWSF
jgi:outer membrane protein assembly factor BamA